MAPKTIIHSATEQRLKNFLVRPSHALLLNAPAGMGKTTIGLWLISQLTDQPIDKLANSASLKMISPDGKSISINQVRELAQFLKLKTVGSAGLRRFIIIEQAETLTLEAQNAFLKMLEEPPADTLIILTSTNTKALLPTVLSRSQQIVIQRPTKIQLQKLFGTDDFERLYNLSGGRPGLLMAMADGDQNHPLAEAVESAKQLLKADNFERLNMIDGLAKQKDDNFVLEALQLISSSGLSQAASRQNGELLQRWQKILAATYSTKTALRNGAQAKLALTKLMLDL